MKKNIPSEYYIINDRISVCSRIYGDSCYLYYHINDFCYFNHDIKSNTGLKIIVCQMIVNKLVKMSDLEGYLELDFETINNWVNDFKKNGSKSFRQTINKEITFLSDFNIRCLQNIVDKNISIREIEFLQNINIKLINKAFEEYRLLPYQTVNNNKILLCNFRFTI